MKHFKLKLFICIFFLIGYGYFFIVQEKAFQKEYIYLKALPSVSAIRLLTGYGHQLAAEIAFVQSSVFLGGLPVGSDPRTYMPILAHNYKTVAKLYPEFIDTYYYAQSYLAGVQSIVIGVDVEATRAANSILAVGRIAEPNNLIYPFFQGFNHFSYLNEPQEAAKIYREASQIPKAPPVFAHMATLMQAEGGELEASVYGLEILMRTTNDRYRRELYAEEIRMFKQALEVQKAVGAFLMRNQRYPRTLDELVPLYIPALPDFDSAFDLAWSAPNVSLKRKGVKRYENRQVQ